MNETRLLPRFSLVRSLREEASSTWPTWEDEGLPCLAGGSACADAEAPARPGKISYYCDPDAYDPDAWSGVSPSAPAGAARDAAAALHPAVSDLERLQGLIGESALFHP
ncbi:hypothetical protein [Paludibacterium yongneupense]|uniref:hypothetical protein n=1 Tax=Paludibacterium yongneupense TaxID=400061 RepID=UPI0004061263|nr:hypothetical protein [Paludibacterium yongneupense]